MDAAFAREVTIRERLKSKGYEFDEENQYQIREQSTNGGQEKFLELAMKTEDGEWNKPMMATGGKVFYAEAVGS